MTSEKMLPQLVGIILDEQAQLTLAELTREQEELVATRFAELRG